MTKRAFLAVLGVLVAVGCSSSEGGAPSAETDTRPEPERASGSTVPAVEAEAPAAGAATSTPAAMPVEDDPMVGVAGGAGAEPAMPSGADAADPGPSRDTGAAEEGSPSPCAALPLLMLSEPTLAPSEQAMHEPWPADDRLDIQYSGQAFQGRGRAGSKRARCT